MSSLLKILVALVGVYLAVKLFKLYQRRRRLVEAVERLPGPPHVPYSPVFNHATIMIYLDLMEHKKWGSFAIIYHLVSTMYTLFPDEGVCRFWLGWKPVVMLFAPETVEPILQSTSVLNKADEYRFFEPWIGEGLVTSKRSKWRFRRKILTPAFHFRILNDFLPIMNAEASKLVRKLNQDKFLGAQRVDVAPLIALCTLDTICETAMGVNINCQGNDESVYVQSLYQVGESALSRVARPWLWWDSIFFRTQTGRKFTKAKDMMHDFSLKVIIERRKEWERMLSQGATSSELQPRPAAGQDREQANAATSKITFDDVMESSFFKNGNKRLAFLDLMLHQHLVENSMTIDDIREEVDTFMFAGHDTTAMSISWTLYMLGLHEDIQDRCRRELDEIFAKDETGGESLDVDAGDNDEDSLEAGRQPTTTETRLAKRLLLTDVTNEHMREMKYLDRVIKESLRMWPSIPFVARQMTEDVLVGNKYLIPEGATAVVFTHALHNNPKYYPKPEIFDPDRFLPEATLKRHPFAYIPFSAGPRNCIGQKFAQMELKVILAKVIRNYYIKTFDHRDKLEVVGELVLRSRNGLHVKITPRFQ